MHRTQVKQEALEKRQARDRRVSETLTPILGPAGPYFTAFFLLGQEGSGVLDHKPLSGTSELTLTPCIPEKSKYTSVHN